MSALPPLLDGAVQLTVACPFPGVALTFVGTPGTVGAAGVTAVDGLDSGPVPTAFVALTVNVYAVPFVSPVTVALVAGGDPVTVVGVCAVDPIYGVIVYEVIVLPPLLGAVQLTVACAFPAVALAFVGVPGTVTGVTALEGLDAGLLPMAFVAVTVKV